MQWNARSAVANKISLEHFLLLNKANFVLISETWFKPGSAIFFKGYNLVRHDRADGKAGVAILIKNDFAFTEIKLNIHNQRFCACAVKVLINSQCINLVSFYRPPNAVCNAGDWNNLLSQLPPPYIVGGDFNAHNGLWGSPNPSSHR